MKEQVLNFLKNSKTYCSGEEISQKLGVTRGAIWKIIKKLQAEGYEIESSTKKGYKLVVSPNITTPEEVKENLKTRYMGQTIYYEKEIDSTNQEAKKFARAGAEEGTLVIADKQTAGKGRLGRSWESPSGTGIWMSLILRPHLLPKDASQITLIVGLSLCEAIEEVTGLSTQIKWPNDIIINKKKVCGILTEMSAEMEGIKYIIPGIGINVNMKAFPENLPHATSLAIEGGKEYSRKAIITNFLEKFEVDYEQYKKDAHLGKFKERYEKKCINLHQKVKILGGNQEIIAEALGITHTGALRIRHEDGTEEEVFSGEVSVRGLYDYI